MAQKTVLHGKLLLLQVQILHDAFHQVSHGYTDSELDNQKDLETELLRVTPEWEVKLWH